MFEAWRSSRPSQSSYETFRFIKLHHLLFLFVCPCRSGLFTAKHGYAAFMVSRVNAADFLAP